MSNKQVGPTTPRNTPQMDPPPIFWSYYLHMAITTHYIPTLHSFDLWMNRVKAY